MAHEIIRWNLTSNGNYAALVKFDSEYEHPDLPQGNDGTLVTLVFHKASKKCIGMHMAYWQLKADNSSVNIQCSSIHIMDGLIVPLWYGLAIAVEGGNIVFERPESVANDPMYAEAFVVGFN